MSLSDSMFLFKIVVEEVKSFVECQEFNITSQFAELFSLNLKEPNEVEASAPKHRKQCKRKSKVRDNKTIKIIKAPSEPTPESKIRIGHSILIVNNVNSLVANMKTCPLQLTLWNKADRQRAMGSTFIPWSPAYFDYLNDFIQNGDSPPVIVEGTYNVFDELSSKRMATVKMYIKMSCFKDKLTRQFRSLYEDDSDSFKYMGLNTKKTSTIKEIGQDVKIGGNDDTGKIKTINYGGKTLKYKRTSRNTIQPKKIKRNPNRSTEIAEPEPLPPTKNDEPNDLIDLVKSGSDSDVNKQVSLVKSKSFSTLEHQNHLNTLNYIFGDGKGPFGNKVYCVGYFTVQSDLQSKTTSKTESKSSLKKSEGSTSSVEMEKFKFNLCDSKCPRKQNLGGTRSLSHLSINISKYAAENINVKKCDRVECNARTHRAPPTPPDERILVDFAGLRGDCCNVGQKVEQVVGGMKAKMKVGDEHPCYCTCECTFGFTKKTTYCGVCGGYELAGDELSRKLPIDMPYPCPIFHKLQEKKGKPVSASGSDSKRNAKTGKKTTTDKSGESDKDSKKGKKKKKDERFQFNYGYKGIPPQIGHSQCAMPCTGTLGNVPKHMGWLWTADNVPGMKFRPNWKPGATNKYVVRLLRMAKYPDQVLSKRRKKDTGKKRPLKRPLLVVHKKDGEFTVTMETMRTFNRPRALNQQPYEDKDVITYTIGRSEEENRERRKKKERAQRRLEREQREFIQSAFKNMCQDICLKTYQQALGILPDAEDPECQCYPAQPGPDRTNLEHSCSCSEDSASLCSDTDSDEWIVEFTPPNALFDPTYKCKKIAKIDNETQYTYLDYRVKLVDRFGNPVPRFFIGPDGKKQCSDLGGFWSPDHNWLEINVDGFIGPDNRWAPHIFIGPNGEQVDAETGKFQAADTNWYVVGVDGYVDCQGKWRFYPKPKGSTPSKKARKTCKEVVPKKGEKENDKKKLTMTPKSGSTWSCFGDASPKGLSKMGIMGHGEDRKLLLATLKDMLARGEKVAIPKPSEVPRQAKKTKKVRMQAGAGDPWNYLTEETKCRHAVPSEKGIVAVDARGNKTYFRLKNFRNERPKQRKAELSHQGISLSSFHVPCLHSFINSETMKQQLREKRLNALADRDNNVAIQTK